MSITNYKAIKVGFRQHKGKKSFYNAIGFFICIMAITLFCAVNAYKYSGPVIIGTEMNTNGTVEYMCLGNSCENLNNFSWQD